MAALRDEVCLPACLEGCLLDTTGHDWLAELSPSPHWCNGAATFRVSQKKASCARGASGREGHPDTAGTLATEKLFHKPEAESQEWEAFLFVNAS